MVFCQSGFSYIFVMTKGYHVLKDDSIDFISFYKQIWLTEIWLIEWNHTTFTYIVKLIEVISRNALCYQGIVRWIIEIKMLIVKP